MAYQIPLFKLNFDEKEALAAADTIRSGWISTGPKCEELEHILLICFMSAMPLLFPIVRMRFIFVVWYVALALATKSSVPRSLLLRLRTVYVMLVPPLFLRHCRP